MVQLPYGDRPVLAASAASGGMVLFALFAHSPLLGFALAMAASQRSKQLLQGAPRLVETKNKYVVTALREIAESKVTVKTRTITKSTP